MGGLVACPGCGAHVRARESACPHCGRRGAIGLTATAVLMGLALAGCEKQPLHPPEPEYGMVNPEPPPADSGSPDPVEPDYGVPDPDPGDRPAEPEYGVPDPGPDPGDMPAEPEYGVPQS